jgi:hypothetical protein
MNLRMSLLNNTYFFVKNKRTNLILGFLSGERPDSGCFVLKFEFSGWPSALYEFPPFLVTRFITPFLRIKYRTDTLIVFKNGLWRLKIEWRVIAIFSSSPRNTKQPVFSSGIFGRGFPGCTVNLLTLWNLHFYNYTQHKRHSITMNIG